MTTTANIVFSSFTSAADPMPRAWSRFRDQLTAPSERPADRLADPQTGPVCVWRLLASNNRELGRSAMIYRSFDDARAAVFDARLSRHDIEIRSVHGPNAGTHGWFAHEPDGPPLITCGRWYGAHTASVDAAQHSIEAFFSATVLAEGHRRLSADRRRSTREAIRTPGESERSRSTSLG
ncbi:hypothetical protein [Agreia bicolorata]|uniref:Uncharacterized protein n=1 Tax=Agreia bicolorata TaxID=110935 RepID=A0ABR5CCC4_9MICO|nr:hypothetical protein [Agreia bicolorata]KJC63284.1 hypothetical protein TZ00_16650 [Agreia bicolorata]